MQDHDHHLQDRLARIERRLDHIVCGGVVGLCVIAIRKAGTAEALPLCG